MDRNMNWLTAILGFLACYSLAGLIYTFAQGDRQNDGSSYWFWAVAIVAAIIAAFVNEKLHRRRASKNQQNIS
jgi:phosphotransferase system  glucose/maltose/N-acetylglucosamine-specific IIC component